LDAARLGKPHIETALDKSRDESLHLYDNLKTREVKLEARRDKLQTWIDRYLDIELP
jgi:hypothetical protein